MTAQYGNLPEKEGPTISTWPQPATTCTRAPQHAHTYPMSETYTITLRGTDFSLHRSQIEFDGPNLFTACFLTNSKQRRIELHRDPGLFRIIETYLCGYNVLPLDERTIPPTMSPETVLLNLRADAIFYQLRGLVRACDDFIEEQHAKKIPPNQYLILGNVYRCHFSVEFDELQSNTTPASTWQLHAGRDILSKAPLIDMITAESMLDEGIDGIQAVAKVEGFASHTLGGFDSRRLKLIGWHIDESRYGGDDENFDWDLHDIDYRLLIVLEDLKAE